MREARTSTTSAWVRAGRKAYRQLSSRQESARSGSRSSAMARNARSAQQQKTKAAGSRIAVLILLCKIETRPQTKPGFAAEIFHPLRRSAFALAQGMIRSEERRVG